MIEEGVALAHRILIVTEAGKTRRDEMVQRLQRIGTRHRPAKGRKITEVIGKAGGHHVHHLAGDGVRFEAAALRRRHVLRQ